MERVDPAFIDACFQARPDRLRVEVAGREELVHRMLRGGYPEVVGRRRDEARDAGSTPT
jgi:hypothetical protein